MTFSRILKNFFFTFRVVAPLQAVVRPKGLGLGAERPKQPQTNGKSVTGSKPEEELVLKKGAFVCVTKGPLRDRYGEVILSTTKH